VRISRTLAALRIDMRRRIESTSSLTWRVATREGRACDVSPGPLRMGRVWVYNQPVLS